jgi:hypothetical protein
VRQLTPAECRALAAFVDLALVTEQSLARLCRVDEYVTARLASYGQLVALGELAVADLYDRLREGGHDG